MMRPILPFLERVIQGEGRPDWLAHVPFRIGCAMSKKLMTVLALVCVLTATGCVPWWYHDHDRGGYGHGRYERGGGGFERR